MSQEDDNVSDGVVTAAELEAMSPQQRRAVFEASIITDLDDAPPRLVERARARTERRIVDSETPLR